MTKSKTPKHEHNRRLPTASEFFKLINPKEKPPKYATDFLDAFFKSEARKMSIAAQTEQLASLIANPKATVYFQLGDYKEKPKYKTHWLKILPEYMQAKKQGLKPFEIRLNDRGFKVGHNVIYRTWCPKTKTYLSEYYCTTITYITDFPPALRPGYVVFAERPL